MSMDAVEARQNEHVDLVSKSFPEIRCIRCGYEDFYIMPNVAGPSGLAVVTLACKRCGHLDQHLISVLRESPKPVPGSKIND